MKSFILAGLVLPALTWLARADDARFTSTLSPADLAAAGLSGLSPEQRARLDELVDKYRQGAPAAAALPAAPQAEAPSSQPAASQPAAAAHKPPTEGFLARLKIHVKPSTKPQPAPIVSLIRGKFSGWGPGQVFTLANGQSWQVANGDSYYTPVVDDPKVEVKKSALTGYWLRFPDLDVQVRVLRFGGD